MMTKTSYCVQNNVSNVSVSKVMYLYIAISIYKHKLKDTEGSI